MSASMSSSQLEDWLREISEVILRAGTDRVAAIALVESACLLAGRIEHQTFTLDRAVRRAGNGIELAIFED